MIRFKNSSHFSNVSLVEKWNIYIIFDPRKIEKKIGGALGIEVLLPFYTPKCTGVQMLFI